MVCITWGRGLWKPLLKSCLMQHLQWMSPTDTPVRLAFLRCISSIDQPVSLSTTGAMPVLFTAVYARPISWFKSDIQYIFLKECVKP